MTSSLLLRCLGLLAVTAATGYDLRPAQAQALPCTYDDCALRITRGRIVQGRADRRVARFGWSAPEVNPLATAADSVRAHYLQFRSAYNRARSFSLVRLLASIPTAVLLSVAAHSNSTSGTNAVAVGFAAVFVGFSFPEDSNRRKAGDELSRAIWLYNRNLSRGP